jgi:hypothetical protein
MLARTVAILIAAGGISLAATQSHAESALSIAERYIDKLKSSGKYGDLDLDKLRSERKLGRFDLSKFKSDTKIGGYDLGQLSSSGMWQSGPKAASAPSALPMKAKKISSLSKASFSKKTASYAGRVPK